MDIERFKRILIVILDGVITFFFSVIFMLTVLLVVLRYVFNTSIIGGNEAMEYLFIYTTAIGAAAALGRRDHIKITYFVNKCLRPGYDPMDDEDYPARLHELMMAY